MAWYSLVFVASVCFPKQGNFRDRVFCTLAKESMLNAELVKKKEGCKRLVVLCLSAMGRGAGGERQRGGMKTI